MRLYKKFSIATIILFSAAIFASQEKTDSVSAPAAPASTAAPVASAPAAAPAPALPPGAPAAIAPCVTCHTADGNSLVGTWPKLAGQHANYIIEQLKEFKKGEQGLRPNIEMLPFAQALSEEDMHAVAEYYSKQKLVPGTAEPQYVDLGKRIYQGGVLDKGVPACAACHGASGLGNDPARWPRLAGQHAAYIKEQLLAYRSGERRNGPANMMKEIAQRLSDEQIEAVSSYIEGMSGVTP